MVEKRITLLPGNPSSSAHQRNFCQTNHGPDQLLGPSCLKSLHPDCPIERKLSGTSPPQCRKMTSAPQGAPYIVRIAPDIKPLGAIDRKINLREVYPGELIACDVDRARIPFHLLPLSGKLIKRGIVEIDPKLKNPYIFLHGQSKLLEDEIISNDLDQIRELFDEIEKKTTFIDILENAGNAKGVQIFIGSQNFLFKHSGLSMVMAPYKNNEQEIIGAIGVVGPTRLNYSKIVPLVDYTSKIIGKVVK